MADEVYNDSSIPHGAPVITITETGVSYDCDADVDFGLDKTKVVKRNKANGAAGGSFGIKDFIDGSCPVQVATAATPDIRGGQHFTTDKTGARVFIVTEASHRYAKENYDIQNIGYTEQLNP